MQQPDLVQDLMPRPLGAVVMWSRSPSMAGTQPGELPQHLPGPRRGRGFVPSAQTPQEQGSSGLALTIS